MTSTARKLQQRIALRRRSLLRRYDDAALHQLRVALRRLRSLLRYHDGEAASTLRDDLGALAAATNAARDWDTLVARAQGSLRPRDFRRVRPWLARQRAASHAQALEMLRSPEWERVMRVLEESIEAGELAADRAREDAQDIERARRAVTRAWRKARREDDDKPWHKLRLSIKALRYTFDSQPRDSLDAPMRKALKHCKRLQEILGAWHDTAVHEQMVRRFLAGIDRDAEAELHQALKSWCGSMRRDARELRREALDWLEGKGADLLG